MSEYKVALVVGAGAFGLGAGAVAGAGAGAGGGAGANDCAVPGDADGCEGEAESGIESQTRFLLSLINDVDA